MIGQTLATQLSRRQGIATDRFPQSHVTGRGGAARQSVAEGWGMSFPSCFMVCLPQIFTGTTYHISAIVGNKGYKSKQIY